MEKFHWKVEGMTCSNCALSVHKFLEKAGMDDIAVNPISGTVDFSGKENYDLKSIENGINKLGYTVLQEGAAVAVSKSWLHSNKNRFLITLPFTLLLMLHMFHRWLPVHWIMNGWVQLALCTPVFVLGMFFFGKSAIHSLKSGAPNMNVLVALGAFISFIYSLIGLLYFNNNNYLFFETTASIITLVLLGNYLEEATLQSTQKALKSLLKSQKVMANMIAFDDKHQEQIFLIENTQLRNGDLILIKTGEQVPTDCKILWGDCTVNESILTGESLPLFKSKKDFLIGGSVFESGTVKAQVTATGNETILSGIIKMVQEAQSKKPPLQKLADKISAIFVPIVITVSSFTFLVNHFFFHIPIDQSIMRSIAVLVISCPCAMGLATPAAISVGLGRAARKGILFRNAGTLESFRKIKQIVFDKTGTLTTGNFEVEKYSSSLHEEQFKSIVYSLEKYSTHPIAKSIVKTWNNAVFIQWKKVEEIKGLGVKAEDNEGNRYLLGSKQLVNNEKNETTHDIYLLKNESEVGWIDIIDELRPEAKQIIEWFHKKNINTVLLTGDTKRKASMIADELGIQSIYAEQSPFSKMEIITNLNSNKPTAMVGDGINDAAALSKATIGISLSDASQLAIQNADIVLMNQGLTFLPFSLGIGQHTFITIKQNLFWAFSYNIIAIPIAASGLLTPTFSAMAMGFSDIMLAAISLRLFIKKII